MIKTVVSYEGFDGGKITETLYFHLNKAELLELELSTDSGSFAQDVMALSETGDIRKVLEVFKKLVGMAYGQRSADGKRFVKTEKIREEFLSSEAYSELLFKLLSNEQAAISFFKGLIPKDILQKVLSEREKKVETPTSDPKQEVLDFQTPQAETTPKLEVVSDIKSEEKPNEDNILFI